MKETETPNQWYRRKYPKENHQGLYDSNLGSPPLWPEWTITEYAKYFMESSLPSEQETDGMSMNHKDPDQNDRQ